MTIEFNQFSKLSKNDMNVLNNSYNEFCKSNYNNYKKITDDIILIDSFFENFEKAKVFFTEREKWKCIPDQGHQKPGYESLLPDWIGKSLMERYILHNQINDDLNSYSTVCNFFNNQNYAWSASNSNCFPHIDGIEVDGVLGYICLINLNNVSVTTKFYTYKDKEYISSEIKDEWYNYDKDINNKFLRYFDKKKITKEQIKIFLDNQNLNIKLINEIKYKPNQAIIYPENLLHCPEVTEEFNENNLRSILRIKFFIKKISKSTPKIIKKSLFSYS